MSNYQVEPIDKPAALTKEAIKSLRKQQVQGLSRRQLMRARARDGHRAVAARGHRRHARLRLAEPDGRLRRADQDRRPRRRSSSRTVTCRSRRGSRPTTRRRARSSSCTTPASSGSWPARTPPATATALNVRALYQRCPHLGCKPNPCLKNFWFECPCHGSRYDRLGIKADGAQFGPAPRSMDRFSITVDSAGILTINTGKITLGPLPVALGQPGLIPPRTPTGLHLMPCRPDRPRSSMSDTPGREPEQRLPVPRPPVEPAPVERFTLAAVHAHGRADARARRPGRPPVVERALGRLPRGRSWSPVHRHLLVLRARPRSGSPSRGSTPRPTPSRSPPSSAATTCSGQLRPLPRRQRRGRHRADASTARTSCSPTSTRTTSTTC